MNCGGVNQRIKQGPSLSKTDLRTDPQRVLSCSGTPGAFHLGEQPIESIRQRIWEALLLSLPKRPDILAIQLGAGFVLLCVLGGIMFLVPPLQVAVSVASVLVVIYFFTRPLFALFAVFVLRGLLDLLWWIPGTIMGLNMLQLFSASVFLLSSTQLFLDLKRLQTHPCFRLLLGYVTLMGIAALRADDIGGNIDSIVRYTSPIVLFFMISLYFDRQSLRRMGMLTIAAVGVIPVGVSLYYYMSGQMGVYSLHGYNRLLGGYKNLHNMALMTLFFTTMFIFWFTVVRSNFKSVVLLALTSVALFTLYKTYIRTGLLGFGVFMIALLIMMRRYRTLAVVLAMGGIFIAINTDMQDRFGDVLLMFDTDRVALDKRKLGSGRWGIWSMSMKEYMSQSPWDLILGLGLGGQRMMTLDWVKMFHSKHITLDPHNDLLLLLYQIGPMGVAVYLGFQWQVVRHALIIRRDPDADRFAKLLATYGIALTATVLVTNAVSNSFVHRTSPGWYYWCICGLVFAEYGSLMRAKGRRAAELRAVPG